MSAPQIPNLNTLRRGGLRGRGHGLRSAGSSTNDGCLGSGGRGFRQPNKDEIIRSTDTDATTSRVSAVDAGYLDDPFAKLLSGAGEVTRRLPLMNRGTYVRTTAIDQVVNTFLSSSTSTPSAGGRKQIISLGAGSDTRYFRLKQKHQHLDLLYHELDFAANTRDKISRLRSAPFVNAVKSRCNIDPLSSEFEITEDGSRLKSPAYHIHPQDLRLLAPGKPALPEVDTTLPTLIISECCLVYMTPDHADAVVQFFCNRDRGLFSSSSNSSSAVPLAIVIYEPIRPNDAFGRTMISNLTARGIQLQTVHKYADLRDQKARLEQNGFKTSNSNSNAPESGTAAEAAAVDINWVWQTWIDEAEKERVEALEWMDEVEEFVLLAQHYCLAFGWRGFPHPDGADADGGAQGQGWKSLPVPKSF